MRVRPSLSVRKLIFDGTMLAKLARLRRSSLTDCFSSDHDFFRIRAFGMWLLVAVALVLLFCARDVVPCRPLDESIDGVLLLLLLYADAVVVNVTPESDDDDDDNSDMWCRLLLVPCELCWWFVLLLAVSATPLPVISITQMLVRKSSKPSQRMRSKWSHTSVSFSQSSRPRDIKRTRSTWSRNSVSATVTVWGVDLWLGDWVGRFGALSVGITALVLLIVQGSWSRTRCCCRCLLVLCSLLGGC